MKIIGFGIVFLISSAAANYHHGSLYNTHIQHSPSPMSPHGMSYSNNHYHDNGNEQGHGHHGHQYVNHYPVYKFDYGVKDTKTGDHKDQWEKRDGDKVIGGYSLDEPDGTKRVVEYTADDYNGFNAIVKKIGHPIPAKPGKPSHHVHPGGNPGHYAGSYANVVQHF